MSLGSFYGGFLKGTRKKLAKARKSAKTTGNTARVRRLQNAARKIGRKR